MGHELHPKCGQNIEKRRRLIIAVRRDIPVRQPLATVAEFRIALRAGKQRSADHLRIRREKVNTPVVTVLCHLGQSQIGKRFLKLNIARKFHPGRAHRRVAQVIADARDGTVAHQRTRTDLHTVTTNGIEVGMALWQTHFGPLPDNRSRPAVSPFDVGLKSVVLEQIELDQLQPLPLQVQKSAINTAPVAHHMFGDHTGGVKRSGATVGAACPPIVGPVHPGRVARCQKLLSTPAIACVAAHFAQKTIRTLMGKPRKTAFYHRDAVRDRRVRHTPEPQANKGRNTQHTKA